MASAVAAAASDLPQVFGRYLLLKRLSRGGMGEIFLAKLGEIQGFEKPVIIKKILPNLSADEEFVKRFIDEAQVAIKLNHANIAPVYEVGKVAGDYFLALEYVEGRDLRRLTTRCREERYRLPADICLYIGRELASGLGYAHRRTDAQGRALSLVHCDISPPNVMVSFEGEVKIIDFGIAKSAIRIAGSNPNVGFGKFGYMAPEQLIRGATVDKRTDIYAAGVVLYELLTGERLFQFPEGADYRQIARMVSKGEFLPPSVRDPALDPALDPIVCRALESRADERYQTAEEFRDAISAKLSHLNPTISGDALAHLMRSLFVDEIDEERALVASTRAVAVEEYREAFTDSVFQTVTFARAGVVADRAPSPLPPPPTPLPSRIPSPLPSLAASHARASSSWNERRWLAGAMVGAGTLFTALLVLAVVRYRAPTVAPIPPAPLPAMRAPLRSPPPARPSEPEPIVVPLPDPEPARAPVTRDPSRSRRHPGERTARTERPRDDGAPPVERPRAPVNDAAVVAKFRTVKKEYESFKSEYGARLEDDWNAITGEITFGRPGEKYQKVNAMLDALRRNMSRVRDGG